jgi:hypothetical protein
LVVVVVVLVVGVEPGDGDGDDRYLVSGGSAWSACRGWVKGSPVLLGMGSSSLASVS